MEEFAKKLAKHCDTLNDVDLQIVVECVQVLKKVDAGLQALIGRPLLAEMFESRAKELREKHKQETN